LPAGIVAMPERDVFAMFLIIKLITDKPGQVSKGA
jgi:hypothetical protein